MKRLMLSALLVAGLMTGACTRIGPGYVGIKVSMAGSSRGVSEYVGTTGWQFYNPLLTSILEYPTFVQNVVWTANTAEGKPLNEEITFTNKDQMVISVDINLSYHLEPDRVPAFYVKFRNDDLTQFTMGYLRNTARDMFNREAGHYNIEQIMGDNGPFLQDVRMSLQRELAPLGVVIDQFGIIGAPRPPQPVVEAINAKVHATQLALQKQNELVQVQADAAKTVAQAEGQAKATLTAADAQAAANRKLAESLTDNLIRYETLKRWNGQLPTVSGGATPFITLPQQR